METKFKIGFAFVGLVLFFEVQTASLFRSKKSQRGVALKEFQNRIEEEGVVSFGDHDTLMKCFGAYGLLNKYSLRTSLSLVALAVQETSVLPSSLQDVVIGRGNFKEDEISLIVDTLEQCGTPSKPVFKKVE